MPTWLDEKPRYDEDEEKLQPEWNGRAQPLYAAALRAIGSSILEKKERADRDLRGLALEEMNGQDYGDSQ
ncbi:MAG: hypothetical protein AAGD22_02915 [Verrucomicrobiota bacterium]